MRIRIDKKDANLYLKPRAILLSRNWFEDMGMPEGIGRYLTNFDPKKPEPPVTKILFSI